MQYILKINQFIFREIKETRAEQVNLFKPLKIIPINNLKHHSIYVISDQIFRKKAPNYLSVDIRYPSISK